MKNLSVYLIFTLLISVLTASCGAARNSTVLRHEDNYWLSFKVIHQKIASVPLSKNTFHVKPAEADRLRTTFKRVLSKNEAAGLSIPTVRNLFIQLNQERSTNLKLIFDNSLESPIYLRFSRQLRPESLNKARPKRRFILIIETFSTEKSLPTWTLNMLESLALEGIPGTFFATLIGITAASTVCLSTLYSIARKSSVPFRDLYKKKLLKYPEILSQIGKQTAFYEKVETTNSFIQDLVVKSRLIQASPISWLTSSTLAPFAPNIAFACLGAPFTETILELLRSPVFETIPQKLVLVAPASAISDAYLATILRLKNKTAKDIQLIVLDLHDEHYVDMRDVDALEQLRQLKGPTNILDWRFAQISKTAAWTVSSSVPHETKKFILQDSANKPFEIAQAITNEYQQLTSDKLSELLREYQLPPATNLLVFDETSQSLSITRPDEPISCGVFFCKDPSAFDPENNVTQITFNGRSFQTTNNFIMQKVKSANPLEASTTDDQKIITTLSLSMNAMMPRIKIHAKTHEARMNAKNKRQKTLTARVLQSFYNLKIKSRQDEPRETDGYSKKFATFFEIERIVIPYKEPEYISFDDFCTKEKSTLLYRADAFAIKYLSGFFVPPKSLAERYAEYKKEEDYKNCFARKPLQWDHDSMFCVNLIKTIKSINNNHKPGDEPIIFFDLFKTSIGKIIENPYSLDGTSSCIASALRETRTEGWENIQNAQPIFLGKTTVGPIISDSNPEQDYSYFPEKDLPERSTPITDHTIMNIAEKMSNGLSISEETAPREIRKSAVVIRKIGERLVETVRPTQICINPLLEGRPRLRQLIEENPDRKIYYLQFKEINAGAESATQSSEKTTSSTMAGAGSTAPSHRTNPQRRLLINTRPPAGSPVADSSSHEIFTEMPRKAIFKKANYISDVKSTFCEIVETIECEASSASVVIVDLSNMRQGTTAEEMQQLKERINTVKNEAEGLKTSPLLFLQKQPGPEDLPGNYSPGTLFASMSTSTEEIESMIIIPGETQALATGGTLETPDRINIQPLLDTRENLNLLIEALPGAPIYYINFTPGI